MAKGKGIRVSFEIPTGMELEFDEGRVFRKAGTAVAKALRKRLGEGKQASGALPAPKRGGQPLKDTGQLIKSVKYRRATSKERKKGATGGKVLATGTREGGRKRNAEVMAIQVATRPIDPMGVTPEIDKMAAGAAQKVLNDPKQSKLFLSMKRKKRVRRK